MGSRAKKTLAASERNNYKRGWYWRRVAGLNHRRLIFLDESAVNTAMTPTHGRAPRGERVHGSAPRSYGEQTSLIGALSFGRGLIAVMTLTGAVDALAFDAYLSRVLAPRLRRGAVVVLDNLNVHKASQVEEVAARRGARILWLAPYSPDFSPIEQCWSKIKTCLRGARPLKSNPDEPAYNPAEEFELTLIIAPPNPSSPPGAALEAGWAREGLHVYEDGRATPRHCA